MNYLWEEKTDEGILLGVTPELQDEAGDIAYVNITAVGAIEKDDTLLVVEADKANIEVAAPFSGEIVKVNTAAENQPSLLDSTDRKNNWIAVIKAN